MGKYSPKYGCTPGKWSRLATKAALDAGIDPVRLLAGTKDRANATVRWHVWRQLVDSGHSYYSIGKASGFDHTSVRYGYLRITGQLNSRRHATVSGCTPYFLPIQNGSIN